MTRRNLMPYSPHQDPSLLLGLDIFINTATLRTVCVGTGSLGSSSIKAPWISSSKTGSVSICSNLVLKSLRPAV
ncbi:hypothetical protein EYC84_001678 [Monilinia fructicola]|uniref:Uncharacterized protein n=1 Tax=Monilinia fructicola TaxID=38448 RepID=A0A5M9JY83_MONFR|nr:hypothetical protein EYC84_001678 [Monilinia fructicola]